jgi:hypothetical protein
MSGGAERERLAYIHRSDPVMLAKIASEFNLVEPKDLPMENSPMNSSTVLDKLITKQRETIEIEQARAALAAREADTRKNDALYRGYEKEFRSLYECGAISNEGKIYFSYNEVEYRVFLTNGLYHLENNERSYQFESISGSLMERLTQTMVTKFLKKSPALNNSQVEAQPTEEQRLRDAIKRFVLAFEELKRI